MKLTIASYWLLLLGLTMICAASGGTGTPDAAAATLGGSTTTSQAAPVSETMAFGRLGAVAIFRTARAPKQVVILLSEDTGIVARTTRIARQLQALGALVAVVDTPAYLERLQAAGDPCSYLSWDFESFSHFLQSRERLPAYRYPLLVGIHEGAALVYALLNQAPDGTFAGGLSLDFSPTLARSKPLCEANVLRTAARVGAGGYDLLPVARIHEPWIVLASISPATAAAAHTAKFVGGIADAQYIAAPTTADDADLLERIAAAYAQLDRAPQNSPAPPSADLIGLPVVEIPATAGASNAVAILLTGDGGWAGLDQHLAAALAARGVAVVALNSLKYFWTARTPEGTTTDVERIAHYALAHWRKHELILIGYSQGADVLPFVLNRLAPDVRARVVAAAAIGIGTSAVFEFHLSNWLGTPDNGVPIKPEADRIQSPKLTCIYGADEAGALCPQLDPRHNRIVALPGGHHYNGDYDAVANAVLGAL